MITNRNFRIDQSTYRNLKVFAAEKDCTLGGAIRLLLESHYGMPNFRCEGYRKWLQRVIDIQETLGTDAAQDYVKSSPFQG